MTQPSKQTTLNDPQFTLTSISFDNTNHHTTSTWNNFQKRKKKKKGKKTPFNYFFT